MLLVAGGVLAAGLYVAGSGFLNLPDQSRGTAYHSPAAGGDTGLLPPPRWPGTGNGSSDLRLVTLTTYPNYSAGLAVSITLRLWNEGNETETVNATDCGPGFVVQDVSLATVYDSQLHGNCPGPLAQKTLRPAESITVYLGWDQRDDSGIPVRTPGWYFILGVWNGTASDPIDVVGHATFISPPVSTFRLAFSIATDRAEYHLGENVNVTITLTNVGNETAVLQFGMPCFAQVSVFNETGVEVVNSTWFWSCIQILWSETLPPGGSAVRGGTWDLKTFQWTPVPAPATYRLVPSFVWLETAYQSQVVQTDTTTIYVAP